MDCSSLYSARNFGHIFLTRTVYRTYIVHQEIVTVKKIFVTPKFVFLCSKATVRISYVSLCVHVEEKIT